MGYQPVWRRGRWVRRRYVVTDDRRIVPVVADPTTEYTPQEPAEGREPAALLKALLALDAGQATEVEAFCSRFGLLGLMHEQVDRVLHLRDGHGIRSSASDESRPTDPKLAAVEWWSHYLAQLDGLDPGSTEWLDVGAGIWRLVSFWDGEVTDKQQVLATVFGFPRLRDDPNDWDKWPASANLTLLDPSRGVYSAGFSLWAPPPDAFGSDPAGRSACLLLEEPHLWDAYEEHLDFFQAAVEQFQRTAGRAALGQELEQVEDAISYHLRGQRAVFACAGGDELPWQFGHRSPSLLTVAYELLAEELARGRVPTLCDFCGHPFIPIRSDAKFCSPAHKASAWARDHRGHKPSPGVSS